MLKQDYDNAQKILEDELTKILEQHEVVKKILDKRDHEIVKACETIKQ